MGKIYDPTGRIIADMKAKTGEPLPDWHLTQEQYDDILQNMKDFHHKLHLYGSAAQ